jgi:hypothetical protein
MADDVVFMLPGQSPFGKEAFVASLKALTGVRFVLAIGPILGTISK